MYQRQTNLTNKIWVIFHQKVIFHPSKYSKLVYLYLYINKNTMVRFKQRLVFHTFDWNFKWNLSSATKKGFFDTFLKTTRTWL